MIYNVIGLMSGSSLDGLDIAFVEFNETAGKWSYEIKCAACIEYENEWTDKLRDAVHLSAKDYQLLHTDFGRFLGENVNEFIEKFQLHHKVSLIASHGHTTFHFPEKRMTHQLGDGAAIGAETQLPVVSDLRSMDIAFGGQGAPIVPLGEKLLFPDYHYFLNIGGIANVSLNSKRTNNKDSWSPEDEIVAFDICAANRVLNMLAAEKNKDYDEDGIMASSGKIDEELLTQLNELDYYSLPYPKSLANSFGTDIIFPLIKSFDLSIEDALRTYVEHIAIQIKKSLQSQFSNTEVQQLMITGGGAFNKFLISRISKNLEEINFEIYLPEDEVIIYKESLIMALLGILRWREQYTVLSSVTGALRNSIGGALWLGTEA
ncbi:MAG TPA: anhydro-N-acetylmuramic acid kinase [Hanamia sp.]|nr:anhydro-N-acetylmuramic acid kinase [Hanamia sp.]